MASFLKFEHQMGLTVDEDVETVRKQIADASDGLVELHVNERKVFVRADAIKYAEEEAEAGPRKPMGFDTNPAVVKS